MNIDEIIRRIIKEELELVVNEIKAEMAEKHSQLKEHLFQDTAAKEEPPELGKTPEPPPPAKPAQEPDTPIVTETSQDVTASSSVTEIEGYTYEDLINAGWTNEAMVGTKWEGLLPQPTFDREVTLNNIKENYPEKHKNIGLLKLAKLLGKERIEDVTDDELKNCDPKIIELSISEMDKFMEGLQSTPTPPPPPKEGNTTTKDMLKSAAGSGSVPPAPIFTPTGVKPV